VRPPRVGRLFRSGLASVTRRRPRVSTHGQRVSSAIRRTT